MSEKCLSGKIVKINCHRGVKKSYPRGVKRVKKAIRGGKIDKKLSEGGKIGGKNCPRGIKLDKTVRRVTRKYMSEGCKKILFCVRGVRKLPVFVQGVEKFPILSKGVTENSPPLLFF